MDPEEILKKINDICWTEFSDIGFGLLSKKKYFTKALGEYEVVSTRYYKGTEEQECKTPYLHYIGKGEWQEIVIHFKNHEMYLAERRWHIPKVKGGDCVDYQGSEFYEMKPKGKGYVKIKEIF
jgi:hypothetical protein